MRFVYDDGGRAASGFKGSAGDCVCRAVAIASGKPYAEVYAAMAKGAGSERGSRGRSARNGVRTSRKWFKDLMCSWGFAWTPTMGIGTGCKVHLHDGELPPGRLVVAVSKHFTAVIDGVVRDTHNPQREVHAMVGGPDGRAVSAGVQRRCVYGYYTWLGAGEGKAA